MGRRVGAMIQAIMNGYLSAAGTKARRLRLKRIAISGRIGSRGLGYRSPIQTEPELHDAGAALASVPAPVLRYFRPYWKKIDDPSFKLIANK